MMQAGKGAQDNGMPEEQTVPQRFYQRRWFSVLATFSVFVLLFLVALPYGISYGVYKLLQENGGEEVAIEDIDFNIFNGRAAIENLQVSAAGKTLLTIPRLDLDVDWLPLFSRRVLIRSISVEGVRLVVSVADDGSLRAGGVSIPPGDDTDVDDAVGKVWGVGLEALHIANSTIDYNSPEVRLLTRLDDVSLSELRTWTSEPAPIVYTGAINNAATRLDGRLPPLSSGVGYQGRLSIDALDLAVLAPLIQETVTGLEGRLSVDSDVDVLVNGSRALNAGQKGMVRIAGLGLETQDTRVNYTMLKWDGTTAMAQSPGEAEFKIDLKGKLAGEGLAIAALDGELDIRQDSLFWDGTTVVSPLPANGGLQAVVNSRLEGKGLSIMIPAQGLDVNQSEFRWEGELVVDSGETTAVKANGSLNLAATNADAESGGETIRLARIEGIEFGNVLLDEAGDVLLTDLVVRGAVFARDVATGEGGADAGSVLSADAVSADRLTISDGNRVTIGNLEWRDVISTVVREPDGQWRPVRILDTLPFTGDDGKTAATESAEKTAGSLRVDEIAVTGKSAMVFVDNSVKPPFRIRQQIARAVLKDIDTARPGQKSRFLLRSSFGRHSRFDVDGTIQPFMQPPTVDLQVALEGVALTPLSPYTIRTLGYSVKSGQLDADSNIRISKGRLDGSNRLTIRALEVKAAANASQEELEAQLDVPLDTALNMLRDDNDTIKLDLPVRGNLDNPDFDISSVINTAVGKAVKQGSLTYLTLALQPYGALITVAKMAGEAAARVRLQPVEFAAGSSDALVGMGGYLEKVAGIMQERPEINIKVCGLAVAGDRLALVDAAVEAGAAADEAPKTAGKAGPGEGDRAAAVSDEQLLELASRRADYVKERLVSDQAVSAARLVDCQPRIGKEGTPRVDLLI
jgi:hypothetical protein